MTLTQYAAAVTDLIDPAAARGYEFPDSFDSDVEACFLQRLSPEQAAEKLTTEYAA